MIIKVLSENTASDPAFLTEHGLSLYIEANGHKILFDSGQSDAFARNAVKLHVDLSKVDAGVLSHTHYDHSGGLQAFLNINREAPVYVSQYAFDDYLDKSDEFIGLNGALHTNPRLVSVMETFMLGDGLEIVSGEERECRHPIDSAGLKARRNGVAAPDDFRHEQYLLITEGEKRVLVSGCSHKGIVNIMHWFRPDILIGGFHYMLLDPLGEGKAALDAAAEELMGFDTVYYTCHCTGVPQFEYLKARMKNRLFYLSAGQEIEM